MLEVVKTLSKLFSSAVVLALIKLPECCLNSSIFFLADCTESVLIFPYSDILQLCESLLFWKSSIIPIAENFLTKSTFPFFLSVTVRTMPPMLLAGIMGRAFFYLLGGNPLLNAVIVSIYFNYIAVEGLMPKAKGSVEKSTSLG